MRANIKVKSFHKFAGGLGGGQDTHYYNYYHQQAASHALFINHLSHMFKSKFKCRAFQLLIFWCMKVSQLGLAQPSYLTTDFWKKERKFSFLVEPKNLLNPVSFFLEEINIPFDARFETINRL